MKSINWLSDKVYRFFLGLRINPDFLLLFLLLIISNFHYLSKAFFPIHDTLEVFTFYHFFYSEWFTRGEIPQWFPHVTYGVPTNFYQLRNITPVYYVFMLIGKVFGIKDVIFLYKISVIGEQCVFLTGMYKLSRYLFKQRITVFLVCVVAISGIIWHSAINFNFRLYAFFPLVTYCLLLFFEKQKEGFLWLAGITCLVGGMGVTIYFLGLWGWVYFTLAFVLFLCNRKSFKNIFQLSKKNILYFCVFIGLIALTLIFLKSSINFLTLVSTERKTSGATTIETFLKYGRLPQVKNLLRALFVANEDIKVGVPYDNTIYMGLVPLLFLVWSIINVRDKRYYVFLGLATMLIWLSFGGYFASIVYRFPALAYYRHIGHVYSLVKIILIICAGYGIDHFWEASGKKKVLGIFICGLILLFVCDVFVNDHQKLFHLHQVAQTFSTKASFLFSDCLPRLFVGVVKFPVILFLLVCSVPAVQTFRRGKGRLVTMTLSVFLFLSIFLDLFSFQQLVYKDIPKIPQSHYSWLRSARVRVADYQAVRALDPTNPVEKDAYELVMLSNPTAKYVSAYNFIQFDRCDPGFRVDLASQGVLEFISIPNIKRAIIGCFYPKVRLVPDALYSDDLLDLARVAMDFEAFKRMVVLPKKEGEGKLFQKGVATPHPGNKVEVISYSPNKVEMDVKVLDKQGSWLIYADAFNPNWRAFLDGKKVKIHRAYLAFKALFVEPGKHRVVFSLSPILKIKSAIVALFGLFFGLTLTGLFLQELFVRKEC